MILALVFAATLSIATPKVPAPHLSVIATKRLQPGLRARLAGVVEPNDYGGEPFRSDLHLWVERGAAGNWRRLASVRVHLFDSSEGAFVRFFAGDFDRDGRPEMAVQANQLTADGHDVGEVIVFRWAGHRIKRLTSVGADCGFDVGDLKHNGGWWIRRYDQFGQTSRNGWPDHFALRGNRLVRVNPSFPAIYRAFRKRLLELLAERPYDPGFWACYGKAVRYGRIHETRRAAYRHVLRLVIASVKRGRYPWGSWWRDIQDLIADIHKNSPYPQDISGSS